MSQGAVQKFGTTVPRFATAYTALTSPLGPGQYGDFKQYCVLFLQSPIRIEPTEEKNE